MTILSNQQAKSAQHANEIMLLPPQIEKTSNNNILSNHSNTTRANNQGGAGACLLVKDENPRLIEWLAYHYQILPLRYLVIASDLSSRTRPSDVLHRWKDLIHITEWSDVDFGYTTEGENYNRLMKHRNRQKTFLAQCLHHFKEHNSNGNNISWVFLHDVDEYVTFNRVTENDMSKVDEVQKITNIVNDYIHDNVTVPADGSASHIKLTYERKRRHLDKFQRINGTANLEIAGDGYDLKGAALLELRRQLPPMDDGSTTIMEFIEKIRQDPHSPFQSNACHTIPRLVISAKEEEHPSTYNYVSKLLPPLTKMNFETLRFYKCAEKGSFDWNKFEKVAIDVSRLSKSKIPDKIQNVHTPIKRVCGTPFVDTFYSESVLKIHHYIGSWDAYSVKDDLRRNSAKYDALSSVDYGSVYDAQSWLRGFVNNVGIERAQSLLDGVGDWSSTAAAY
eukprot:CAMPEP_0116005114 /NCGR_PEP_ID=MMETSP0321-20121206/986_1 /TAXON_ID=163516 /ORGANISM="Leptocylindrus danicus var. danicus, Strain B650" /LENGTH=448 /DNA_ID=CAMNT_0003473507 /DNA_START=66 /DNA_END=1409 /DNA_ORIENTATION=-